MTKITNISELKAEKERLKLEMEITHKLFLQSTGTLKTEAREFVLKKIVLPAGITTLATMGAKKMLQSKPTSQRAETSNIQWPRMLLTFLPLVLNYFENFRKNRREE